MKIQARFALAAFCCLLPLSAARAQQTTPTSPSPVSETTLNNNTGTPVTRDELKAQKKAQKQQERAANANAKAAKSQARAKKDQDRALQDQEKATGVVPKS